MADSLRKTKPDGQPYRRRDEIETLIHQLEGLSREELVERMRIASPTHRDFLPPECLLHFVRKSKHDNTSRQFELMYKALVARVERAATVPWSTHYVDGKQALSKRGADILELVLHAFEVKLTLDRNGYDDGLDFFEVNFALAVKSLRSTARRKVDLEAERTQPLSYDDDEAISPEVEKAAGSFDPFNPKKNEDPAYRSRLKTAINELPTPERLVVLLSLKDYQDASIDPNIVTISTLLNCNDQTVRNRRKRAIAKLRQALEDLE